MDVEEERIRQRIEEREAALKQKIDELKLRVDRIKRMSDVKTMVQQRPAAMLAGSVVTGFVLKKWTSRGRRSRRGRAPADLQEVNYQKLRELEKKQSSGRFKEHLIAILAGVATRTAMNVLTEFGRQIIPRQTDVRRAERNFRRMR